MASEEATEKIDTSIERDNAARDDDERFGAVRDDDDTPGLPRVTITQMRHNVAAHKTESHRESMKALARRSERHGYIDVKWATVETETGKFDRLTGCKPR